MTIKDEQVAVFNYAGNPTPRIVLVLSHTSDGFKGFDIEKNAYRNFKCEKVTHFRQDIRTDVCDYPDRYFLDEIEGVLEVMTTDEKKDLLDMLPRQKPYFEKNINGKIYTVEERPIYPVSLRDNTLRVGNVAISFIHGKPSLNGSFLSPSEFAKTIQEAVK